MVDGLADDVESYDDVEAEGVRGDGAVVAGVEGDSGRDFRKSLERVIGRVNQSPE